MCRELKILSYLELEGLREIMNQFTDIDTYLECHISIVIDEKKTDNRVVTIEAINGHCLCNVTEEEKSFIFNFIHAISF